MVLLQLKLLLRYGLKLKLKWTRTSTKVEPPQFSIRLNSYYNLTTLYIDDLSQFNCLIIGY